MRHRSWILGIVVAVVAGVAGRAVAGDVVGSVHALADGDVQQDYPSMCVGPDGTPWVVYIAFNGQKDTLKLARKTADGLEKVGTLAGPGIINRPQIAADGSGTLWAIWSELQKTDQFGENWTLRARRIEDGEIADETVTLAGKKGGTHVFSDAETDRQGRVWVTWQAFRGRASDVYARWLDPASGEWSDPIAVSDEKGGGAWWPQIAFGKGDAAWVAFDEADDREFDVKVAVVQPDGSKEVTRVADTPHYEAFPSIAATPDGEGFYVSWERGHKRWGQDARLGRQITLNADKHIETAYIDAQSKEVSRLPCAKPVVAKKAGVGDDVNRLAVNLPRVAVDAKGRPWLAVRYAISKGGWNKQRYWQIVLTRYDKKKGQWSKAIRVPKSTLSQNRLAELTRDGKGQFWMVWPSDLRDTSKPGVAGVYLSKVSSSASVKYPEKPPDFPDPDLGPEKGPAKNTPQRKKSDRYEITFDGKTYKLYWGDFHRHTDLSPDGTLWDGSIVESYRYAYEVGMLDYLGTTDHTDVGPGHYTVYEWWQTQKLADVFQNPNYMLGFYAYEREQSFPWGHRNVVFAERGGPIVYFKRQTYKSSRWFEKYPVKKQGGEIKPQELWDVLEQSGIPATTIAHTPGDRGTGTNCALYSRIDNAVENIVEIYQGKRVSYESMDAPQPRVALPPGRKGSRYNARQAKGTYQKALREGHRLGIFASSDHFSTNVTFGGVFAKAFTRKALMKGFNAKRTLGATDKIFVHFTCNGHLLGSEFKTSEKPTLKIHVAGTANLKRVTVLCNELAQKSFRIGDKKKVEKTYTDERPEKGINRYYVRVEQEDGNMAWASPVWVHYSP